MKTLLGVAVLMAVTVTAFGECPLEEIENVCHRVKDKPTFIYGFAFGMETERNMALKIIQQTMVRHNTSARKEALQAAYDEIAEQSFYELVVSTNLAK